MLLPAWNVNLRPETSVWSCLGGLAETSWHHDLKTCDMSGIAAAVMTRVKYLLFVLCLLILVKRSIPQQTNIRTYMHAYIQTYNHTNLHTNTQRNICKIGAITLLQSAKNMYSITISRILWVARSGATHGAWGKEIAQDSARASERDGWEAQKLPPNSHGPWK